jgi:hypothetical protein
MVVPFYEYAKKLNAYFKWMNHMACVGCELYLKTVARKVRALCTLFPSFQRYSRHMQHILCVLSHEV